MLREILAPNPSPMTLAGTRTWIVGERRVALIDPGPAIDSHVEAVADAIGGFDTVEILLTHDHPDHAGAAEALAARLGAPIHAGRAGNLREADTIDTDAGAITALATPGHSPDHFAFHWPAGEAIFCGDLMMGGLDTALVAPPEGDLAGYLISLARLASLRPRRIHPAHGPSFDEPASAIDRYIRHREARVSRVRRALRDAEAPLSERVLLQAVYGDAIPPGLEDVATGALRAYLGYLESMGEATSQGGGWVSTAGGDR